jgi:uncharacterized protein YkwD
MKITRPLLPVLVFSVELMCASVAGAAPTLEWTYHKSPDGSHPDGNEQMVVWLMNRARQNPTAEGAWLATTQESEIAFGRSYFNVDVQALQSEFASYAATPPAAFNVLLYNAAKTHSDDLIQRDAQDHNGQFDRVDAAGFHYSSARGNVFSYASSALNAHGAWNIDWGTGGIGHRMAVMSLDGDYSNVGIAAVAESNQATQVGSLVVTGNYCVALENGVDHFNRFVVGTVWKDLDGNGRYDPGEGDGGVRVMPDKGTYYAITAGSGGYAIPIVSPDVYSLTFSGTSIPTATRQVTVGHQSVLLDYQVNSDGGTVDRSGLDWRVTEIYLATMSYAPDNEGLQYWVDQIETNPAWTPTTVAQSFFDQPLVQQQYPQNQGYDVFIEALYQNIFGRAADESGYNYWLAELESGRVRRNQMIIALIEGGWDNPDATTDMARFANRVQVGLAFAAEQEARGIVYSALSTADKEMLRQIGRDLIAGVTADTTTRDQAIANIPAVLDGL